MSAMRRFLGGLFASALLAGCAANPAVPPEAPSAPAPELFHFHADLWANLHQVLFHEAVLPRPGFDGPKSLAHRSVAVMADFSAEEAAAWHDALRYYDAHFSVRDSFSDPLIAATRGLTASRDPALLPAGAGVSDDWRDVLVHAGPVYRAHFWPRHEATDRAYIEAMKPLLAANGAWFAHRLAAVWQTAWPTEPIDVEVTPVVPPFGASTIGEPPFNGSHAPLITVSSLDEGYAGESGLEMIFHESSHLLVDKVQGMLDESAKRQGKTLPRGLWHFVLFYTAGRVAKERLGPAYVPYWERPAMQASSPPNVLPVLVRAWQPYLDGQVPLPAAVDAVVAGF